ncbi:hypothetical protein J4G08_02815 [Candidatus Poribacteria bacterium]|nr:hypothetical protein [Candidatus Poribacteria bacterium]
MKKRTLVCFLIFTLCIFHSSIPGTVFGQDDASLAQQVYDEYSDTLLREDLKDLVDQVLTALSDPATLQNPTIVALGGLGPALDLVLATPVLIRQVAPDVTDEQIGLLTNDQDIRALLEAPKVRTLLQDTEAVKALKAIIEGDGTTTPDPGDGTTTPDPGDGTTTPDPGDGTTTPDPGDGTTTPDPGDGTTTPDPGDGTTTPDPGDGTTTPDPGDLPPSNLNGLSRLGGLSLNRVSGRAFVREIVKAAGLPASDADPLVEPVVDFILAQIPQGILPKGVIKQILASQQPFSVFAEGKGSQLDFENFGNAITPSLVISDFADISTGNFDVKKYLTSDNLNVYVRVPSVLEGGNVKFNLNGRTVEGKRITPVEFQQDTIPYTFRLDESLAAANLPAWPGSDTEIFSSVVLRYSVDGEDFDSHPMERNSDGVWEFEFGIYPKGNVFYYFEVTLTNPVKLEVINPEALIQIAAGTSTADDIKVYKKYIIENWSMPDPRNLQLAERGIIEALFDADLRKAMRDLQYLPEVIPLLAAAYAGEPIEGAAIANAIPQREINKLQNLFFRNVNRLTSPFEGKPDENGVVYRGGNFDPLLASVFSVPEVDIETGSFWFANIDSIYDGASNLEAVVYNANNEPVDRIMVDFEVDTTAPAADIMFGDGEHNFGENVTGYQNSAGAWVATSPNAGAAYLNITSSSSDVGEGKGYLIYQMIPLDENGKPDPADTWLRLTVENSMVASDIWKIVREQLEGQSDPALQAAAALELDDVLTLLNAQLVQQFANPFLKPFGIKLTEEQSALLVDLIGAAVQDLNLIPITYDTTRVMMMPIQGENLELLEGNFGIRAMGIDTLFNVGSHVAPTHLKIVAPEYDRASVTMASLGDVNLNDNDDPYESGTIYENARDVTLTVTVNERTVHPGTIMVQYMDAAGTWQNIGELNLVEGEGATEDPLTIDWSAPADLAGDTVMVRTVTTNGLQLKSESDPFSITLDPDVFPVDPKVLVVEVDDASIIDDTSPDSGAPRGNIMLTGYAARRTVPATNSIRVDVSMDGETWTDVGTVEVMTEPEHGIDGDKITAVMFKGNTLADVYKDDMLHIHDTSSYIQWSLDLDTVALGLPDSITKENLDAAHAGGMTYVDLDGNRYMVRAYPVTSDGDDADGVAEGDMFTEKFSLDNVDDVGPLGPTNIVATMTDAYEDTSVFIDNGDGTYTVGGLVDKYDPEVNSPVVTFTITPTAARKTYASVKLLTTLPEDAIIGDITETAEGSGVFTVTIDVGTLMDADELVYNDRYIEDSYIENSEELFENPKGGVFTFQVHALAYDADMNDQTHDRAESGEIIDTVENKTTVNVMNSYRHDPGVIAITVENLNPETETNPDSGAPQGDLLFTAYTYGMTSPLTEGVRFEVSRRGDTTWERITGTVEPPVMVDESDLAGIVGGLVGITQAGTVSGGESEVGIPGIPAGYQKWSVRADTRHLALEGTDKPDETIKLDDTIKRDDAAERDASKDTREYNQYEVRAISLTPQNMNQREEPPRDGREYHDRDGVEAFFSLDNVDDVPPLGPTNITDVADVAGSIAADEDGSYTVSLIADDPALYPTDVTFTIEPTADPNTYVGGKTVLVQTAPDGTVTETDGSLEEGSITIDVGLLANGPYMYHALVADEFGNVQVQGDMPSPVITVHVLNIRLSDITDLTVTAVDGESPDRHVLQETVGVLQGRFPLKESIAVSFNVNNGSLAVGDLTGVLVDGHEVTFTAGSDAENAFSLMADKLSELADGWYTPLGRITKRNGFLTFPLAMINLDNTGPTITIETPTEGVTVNDLPTLLASFIDLNPERDTDPTKPSGSGVSMADTAEVLLDRLRPEEVVQDAVPIPVDQSMVEQDIDSVVYTRTDKLAGGAYMFTVQVSDRLGNVGTQAVTFAVEGEDPIVIITAPASGQNFDHSPAEITGFFTGGGDVSITKFTINDADMTAEVDENNFTYMPTEALGDGDYTVAVEVTDGSGLTAETSLTFTVELPVPTATITTPAAGQVYDHGKPIIAGDFSGADHTPIAVALSIDNGEAIELVGSDNNQFTYTPIEALSDGTHVVTVVVTDANGRTAETSTDFTVNIPGPAVMIHVPDAGQMYDISRPVIHGEFSGVAAPVSLSLTLNGAAVTAAGDSMFTYTPTDALDDGEYTLVAEVTDANGKMAKATAIFTIRLPVPKVSIQTPTAGQVYEHGMPIITGDFSGANPVAVNLSVDGIAVMASVNENDEFSYTPAGALSDGEHTVAVEITDANGRTAQTSTMFMVDIPGPTVAILSPAAGQEYEHGSPVVRGEFGGETDVELTLAINGEAAEATVEGNKFTYTPDPSLDDGEYTIVAQTMDTNGKTSTATVIFSVRLPVPTVAVVTPAAGQVYDHGMPIIQGNFSGAAPVVVSLSIDGAAVEADVNDNNEFTYTPAVALSDGEHMVVVEVTDANGRTAQTSTAFMVDIPGPSVAIISPAAGQMYDHGMPVISVESSGVAEPVTVSVMVNEKAATANDDGTYSPATALGDGEYTIVATAKDANGKTAEATVIFSVEIPGPSVAINSPSAGQMYNHDMPVVRGEFTGVGDVTVSLTVDEKEAKAEVADNGFTYTPEQGIGEGEHTVAVEVTDANGKTAQATAIFTVEFPMASVMLLSPAAGHTYTHGMPAITGEFIGVGDVEVKLTVGTNDVEAEVDGNQFSHTLADALGHGEHTVTVKVTDANGETAETSAVFTVDIPGPAVAILSPAPGQTYDHGGPVIRGEFSGMADVVEVIFTVNGEVAKPEVSEDENQFTYTPDPSLGTGEHVVFVEVTDKNKKTAQATVVFNVKLDSTAPVISEVSPSGVVQLNKQNTLDENFAITIAAVITDDESALSSVKYIIDGQLPANSYPVERAENKFEVIESFTPGKHSIKLIVASEGGTREFSWQFTLEVDQSPPIISTITPAGTIHAGLPVISASATDDSGVEEMAIVVMDSNGEEVKGDTTDDDEDRTNAGITRLDFHPEAPLSEGTYSIEVRATDAFGNSSTSSGVFTVDFDTAAPIITTSSPQNGARLMYKHDEEARPTISITFADAETGVNVDSIKLVIEAPKWGGGTLVTPINLTDKQKSATQVVYTPAAPVFTDRLAPGEHVVKLEVSDNAQKQGNVSEESDGAREANTAVYQFSFFVEYTDAPILMKPFNFPNPFKDNTRISFGLNRMSTVRIVIYDATLRPVRVLRDNVVMNAGDYTGNNGIGWDGKTSGGEDLARGIYYCQIEVTDGFEPEYAILKLALTR